MITAIDKHTALVLIDLQKGVLGMNVAHPAKDILKKSLLLADAFRKEGLPVVFVNVVPGGPWLKSRKDSNATRSAIAPAADFAEIAEEMKAQPTDLFITKNNWNAFYNTSLHDELQKRGITGIVMAGVSTSIGVEGTARAASERAYNLSFATDAMTDTNINAHQNSIQVLFPRMGEVGTTADILEKLGSRI